MLVEMAMSSPRCWCQIFAISFSGICLHAGVPKEVCNISYRWKDYIVLLYTFMSYQSLLFHITISPKSKNLTLIRLIVILILYPYDVKLMSMSLSFYVNFCQSSSIWFVQFFVSFLSVYIYIVHYLCLISPHGLAAWGGDIKIDWLIDWLIMFCCTTISIAQCRWLKTTLRCGLFSNSTECVTHTLSRPRISCVHSTFTPQWSPPCAMPFPTRALPTNCELVWTVKLNPLYTWLLHPISRYNYLTWAAHDYQ